MKRLGLALFLFLAIVGGKDSWSRHGRGGSASSAAPSAPTNAQIILQGASAQGANQNGHTTSGGISQPNYQTIGWKSVAGATSYNIYRSTTTTPGSNGSYTYLANVTASTAASNYSSYISGSTYTNGFSTNSIAGGIDSVWQDTGATNVVLGTVGPTSGYYYGPISGYTYTVTAVNGSESAQSSPTYMPLFENGDAIFENGVFNNLGYITMNATAPATTPLGFSKAIEVVYPSGSQEINPNTGSAGPGFNVGIMGFNYCVVSVYPTTALAASTLGFSTEIYNDVTMYTNGGMTGSYAYFPAASANTWTTIKIPLSNFMYAGTGNAMTGAAATTQQTSYYKTTLTSTAGSGITIYLEMSFSVN